MPQTRASAPPRAAGEDVVLDIPSIALTAGRDLAELLEDVEQAWSTRFSAFSYPLLWAEGLCVSPDVLFKGRFPDGLPTLGTAAQFAAEKGLGLWLTLDLDLKPVRSDVLHIRSLDGQPSSHACVNAPGTAEAVRLVLQAAKAELARTPSASVVGVAFSVQDLWPMGGGNGSLDLTCFCRYCTTWIETHSPGLLSKFNRRPNPWDLALRDDGSGIAHLNNITPSTTPGELVSLSRARGFLASHTDKLDEFSELASDPATMNEWADYLLQYARMRSTLTIEAISRITDVIRTTLGSEIKVAATASDYAYDWIGGTFLADLDASGPLDEYWIDPSNTTSRLQARSVRWYMFDRSRYYLLGFTDFLETSISPVLRSLAGLDDRDVRRGILDRAASAVARLVTPMAKGLVSAEDRGAVFAIPAVTESSIAALVERFAPEPPEVVRDDFLRQLREAIGSGDGD